MKRILLVMVCLALVAGMVFAQAAPEANAKEDEVYKIVYYHNSSAGGQDPAKDPILKALDEKLGIDLSVEVITTDFESKLNLEVSSGNAPDIMQLKSAQFKTLEEQGVLLPLEDYLPTMKNFMQRYPDILDDPTLRYNGHLYFLNGRDDDSQRIKAYSSLWVRKDWLDKLGLAVPTTLEEFKNVAIAFATQDPDGNGINDTFGFCGMGGNAENKDTMYAWNPIFGAFGVGELNDWQIQDGKVFFGPTSERYKEALVWIRDFIATGAVDPDIMLINTYDQIREKVYRNQVGLMYMTWAEFVKAPFNTMLAEMTPDAQWIQIAPPVGPYGDSFDSIYNVPGFLQSVRCLSADLANNPEKLQKVLDYLDYIVFGEGLNLVCYGIEGTHWNYVDGQIVTTDKIGEVSYSWMHQVMGRLEKEYMSIKFPYCAAEVQFAANLPRIDSYKNFVTIPASRNLTDLNRYVDEETVRFMYGRRDISEFSDFVNTLYKTYGLGEYEEIAAENLKNAGLL